MITVQEGTSKTLTALMAGEVFNVVAGGGGVGSVVDQAGNTYPIDQTGMRRAFGPLEKGESIVVAMQRGSCLVGGGVSNTSDLPGYPLLSRDTTGSPVGLVDATTREALSLGSYRATPRTYVTFADSRGNLAGSGTVPQPTDMVGTVASSWAIAELGDCAVGINCGVGGTTIESALTLPRGSGQGIDALLAAKPEIVDFEFGFNDIGNWNGSGQAAFEAARQLDAARALQQLIGVGAIVAVQPCYPATSGAWGSNAATKAQIARNFNSFLRSFCAQHPANLVYVDGVEQLLTAADGYNNTVYYADDRHLNQTGARAVGKLVAQAIRTLAAKRYGNHWLDGSGPNFCNAAMLNPTSGLAEDFFVVNDVGTATFAYSIEQFRGFACQRIDVTPTALSSGEYRALIVVGADIGGATPKYSVAANDILRAHIGLHVSSASGGNPPVSRCIVRQRVYYPAGAPNSANGTTFATCIDGGSATAPTLDLIDYPAVITQKMTVLNTSANTDSLATVGRRPGIHVLCAQSALAPFTVRIYNPVMRKVG